MSSSASSSSSGSGAAPAVVSVQPRGSRRGGCRRALARALRTWLVVQASTAAFLAFLAFFVVYPPGDTYHSPLNLKFPYASLPTWGVQELYHDATTNRVIFAEHRDRIVDWSEPPPSIVWRIAEKLINLVEVTLPARLVPAPMHLLHMMQGPGQLQVLRTLTLLGVPDLLADRVLSLRDLHVALRSKEHQLKQAELLRAGLMVKADQALPTFDDLPLSKLERLMAFALSIGYFDEVGYRGSHIYVHNHQSVILRKDHPNNLNHLMLHFSNEAYLVWHNLLHAVITPEDADSLDVDVVDGTMPMAMDVLGGTDTPEVWRNTAAGENVEYLGPRLSSTYGEKPATAARRESRAQALKQSVATSASAAPVKTAWEHTLGTSLWTFFRTNPALEKSFAKAMAQVDTLANTALVSDYAWSDLTLRGTNEVVRVDTLVDVGGALGSFLARVLEVHGTVIHNAVLFDQAGSIAAAQPLWSPNGEYAALAPKTHVSLVSGDFFNLATVPKPSASGGATKYVLRQILHDWNDRDAMKILRNLRLAVGSRQDVAVVLVEVNKHVAEPNHVRHFVDFQMLVCCNAKERTASQWDVLFRATGWKLVASAATRTMFQTMELQPDEYDLTQAGQTQASQHPTRHAQQTTPTPHAARPEKQDL